MQVPLFSILILSLAQQVGGTDDLQQTNLLFIMFDDLRPDLSIYGKSHMVTPNFDRLAAQSVIFDHAVCQVAVCNPSRDSLMTGLRPDTVGTYGFQHSFRPHMTLPTQLARSGYNTAGIGKILHWDGDDKDIWNYYQWDDKWYDYQNFENGIMNSSTMPDKVKQEEEFRDHKFAARAVKTMNELVKEKKFFMLGVGFKLPHLQVHIPYKFYELYKGKTDWEVPKKALRFPQNAPEMAYTYPIDREMRFMRDEGALPANRSVTLNGGVPFTLEMYNELMAGYAAGVSFVDKQVGKLLDEMDRLDLWHNTTVVLTADHGMHNGEKGIWNKWSLFDESTRVPLLISHPKSPFKGRHFKDPVELVDVYPTVLDLLKAGPLTRTKACAVKGNLCPPLSGKSLASVVLGNGAMQTNFPTTHSSSNINSTSNGDGTKVDLKVRAAVGGGGSANVNGGTGATDGSTEMMVVQLERNFGLSQMTRCAHIKEIPKDQLEIGEENIKKGPHKALGFKRTWRECDIPITKAKDEVALMGYSMRTPEYRYTAWFHFNRMSKTHKLEVNFDKPPYAQELYDHKNETLAEFTTRELSNLAMKSMYANVVNNLKGQLIKYVKESVVFHDHSK